jgi:hypothetical protein
LSYQAKTPDTDKGQKMNINTKRREELIKMIAVAKDQRRQAYRLRAKQLCIAINHDLRALESELAELQAGA